MEFGIDLQEALIVLQSTVEVLQNLSLMAEKNESTRFEETCKRILDHMKQIRQSLETD